MLKRIALLYYFRWLVESSISYFDIFHSWNIYVNGFQQAWKWFQECFSYKSKVCTQNILGTFLTFSEVGILTFRICWNLFIILKNFNASFSQKWFRVIWGGKTHSALILIQVITHHLEFIVWFQQQFWNLSTFLAACGLSVTLKSPWRLLSLLDYPNSTTESFPVCIVL